MRGRHTVVLLRAGVLQALMFTAWATVEPTSVLGKVRALPSVSCCLSTREGRDSDGELVVDVPLRRVRGSGLHLRARHEFMLSSLTLL